MHAYRANDAREGDIAEGTSPIQVTLDQVAHYMDAVALGHYEGQDFRIKLTFLNYF